MIKKEETFSLKQKLIQSTMIASALLICVIWISSCAPPTSPPLCGDMIGDYNSWDCSNQESDGQSTNTKTDNPTPEPQKEECRSESSRTLIDCETGEIIEE